MAARFHHIDELVIDDEEPRVPQRNLRFVFTFISFYVLPNLTFFRLVTDEFNLLLHVWAVKIFFS